MPLKLTDRQVQRLEDRGFREGDRVGETGTIRPDGTVSISGSEEVTTPLQQTTTERRAQTRERESKLDEFTTRRENTEQQARNVEAAKQEQQQDKPDTTGTQQETQEETPELTGLDAQIAEIRSAGTERMEEIEADLDRQKQYFDASWTAMLSSLKAKYATRINKMKDANDRLLKTKTAIGQRTGRSRYATALQEGILTDEELAGHQRIAELESELISMAASAAQARADNNYKLFNDKYDRFETVQKEMQEQITDLHDKAVDEEKARLDRDKELRLQQKEDFEQMLDKSERSAPSVASKLAAFNTDEERAAFISAFADRTGIDPIVLFGDVEAAMQEEEKAVLSLENTRNLIETRSRNAATSETRARQSGETLDIKKEERQEEEDKKIIRQVINQDLSEKNITTEQAQQIWVTAGFSLDEFRKEFKADEELV